MAGENQRKIRLKDKRTIGYLDELMSTGRWASFNELANEIFDFGALDLYRRTFDTKAYADEHKKNENEQIIAKLNALLSASDELSVNVAIVKAFEQITYTIWKIGQTGGRVRVEDIEEGTILEMPKVLQDIEDEMLRGKK